MKQPYTRSWVAVMLISLFSGLCFSADAQNSESNNTTETVNVVLTKTGEYAVGGSITISSSFVTIDDLQEQSELQEWRKFSIGKKFKLKKIDVIAIIYHVESNVISIEGVQKAILKRLKLDHTGGTQGSKDGTKSTSPSDGDTVSANQPEEQIIPVASNDRVDVSVRIRTTYGSENNQLIASIIVVNKSATQNYELGWTEDDWYRIRRKYDLDSGEGMPLLKDSNGNFFKTNYRLERQSFNGLIDSQGIQKRTVGPTRTSTATLRFDAIISGKQKVALTLPVTLFTDSRGAHIFENDLVVVFNISK